MLVVSATLQTTFTTLCFYDTSNWYRLVNKLRTC